MHAEGKNIIDMYKDPMILRKLNFSEYSKEQDSCVVAFLKGASDIVFDKEKKISK